MTERNLPTLDSIGYPAYENALQGIGLETPLSSTRMNLYRGRSDLPSSRASALYEFYDSKPAQIINLGAPGSAKTLLSGEDLAWFVDYLIRNPNFRNKYSITPENYIDKLKQIVHYISFEGALQAVKKNDIFTTRPTEGEYDLATTRFGMAIAECSSGISVIETTGLFERGTFALEQWIPQAHVRWIVADPSVRYTAYKTRTTSTYQERVQVLKDAGVKVIGGSTNQLRGGTQPALQRYYEELSEYYRLLSKYDSSAAFNLVMADSPHLMSQYSVQYLYELKHGAPNLLNMFGCVPARTSIFLNKYQDPHTADPLILYQGLLDEFEFDFTNQ